MANDKKLAVNVFDNSNTTTQQTPEQQEPNTQNETKLEVPIPTAGQDTQTRADVGKTNDAPTYFIYGGVIVGLLILLTLLIIMRKLNRPTLKGKS